MELLFYFWSGARLLSEAAEFGGDDKGFAAHLNTYLSDPWNALDALLNLLILSLIVLRLYTVNLSDDDFVRWGEDHWAAVVGSNQFAIMVVLCWFRALQFFGYFQSLGVLQIVLRDMLNDIVIWTVLSLVISLGFAFAFVVLLPRSAANHSWGNFMGLHPVYESIWLWVGSGVHSGRETMEEATGTEVPTNLVMPSLMWIYQFIIGVLLVNLLIAMMSDTYARVMDKGRERWTFERAQLILEFKNTKGPLPPPFNVLWTVLVEWRQATDADEMNISGFKTVPTPSHAFPCLCMPSHAFSRRRCRTSSCSSGWRSPRARRGANASRCATSARRVRWRGRSAPSASSSACCKRRAARSTSRSRAQSSPRRSATSRSAGELDHNLLHAHAGVTRCGRREKV